MPLNSKDIQEILLKSGLPDVAHHEWARTEPYISSKSKNHKGLSTIVSLLGNSRFLVHHLLNHVRFPEVFEELVASPYLDRPKDLATMTKELEDRYQNEFENSLASIQKIIRDYKYLEMARIAARDLSGAPFEEIGMELSDLASACIEIGYRATLELLGPTEKKPPYVVMGMGKLGGSDLNFSSDIDLIFVHGFQKQDHLQNTFELSGQISEMIVRILNDRTAQGIGFRVDLDLRPEGKSGVIVNSVESLTLYYEISGAPWERSAWIKGRPVGGSMSLGEEILKNIEPFIYPKHTDASAIHDLKSMKERINNELLKTQGKGFNVKLGVGGIREIEFFASAFQLIYGGKEPILRERNTLKTLEILKTLKLVPEEDIVGLQSAYIFLRQIENRLQMEEERQIHSIPKDSQELLALARRMGFSESESFLNELKKKTEFVAHCFEGLAS